VLFCVLIVIGWNTRSIIDDLCNSGLLVLRQFILINLSFANTIFIAFALDKHQGIYIRSWYESDIMFRLHCYIVLAAWAMQYHTCLPVLDGMFLHSQVADPAWFI
jgi:hypothetical protein